MNRIAIYGAGGFGKEVKMLLDIISGSKEEISFAGFLDDFVKRHPMAAKGHYEDIIIAVADSKIRESIYKRVRSESCPFANIIHPDTYVDKANTIGKGTIICGGVMLTVDICLGEFVIVNLGTTIGHDVVVGDFTSIMPSVNISGGVKIGKSVFIGSGATILQGLTIGDRAVIGAGAVVIRPIAAGQKVAGVPARPI